MKNDLLFIKEKNCCDAFDLIISDGFHTKISQTKEFPSKNDESFFSANFQVINFSNKVLLTVF